MHLHMHGSIRKTTTIGAMTVSMAASMIAFAGPAAADPAEDVPTIVENLPAAGEELVGGLQGALGTAAETQSAEETSHAVGDALVGSGTVLVEGTEQFGMLPLGMTLIEGAVQNSAAPYLQAIDDPATAADLINPEDFATLAENAPAAFEVFQTRMQEALVAGLQGNLVEPSLFPNLGQPALLGSTVAGLTEGSQVLLADTNYANDWQLVFFTSVVAAGAAGDYPQQVEDGAAPAFDAAAPVTDQLIAVIEGM